jgi:4-amino-4-deoxy-L-arabinose transferase and related glycosyltransferases of PMT family
VKAKAENRKKTASLKTDIILIILIALLAFSIRYASLSDVGATTDEPVYIIAGLNYIDNIQHFDISSPTWAVNVEHPPVSKYIYGTAIWLSQGFKDPNYGMFLAAKTASAVMGVLSCIVVYLIGRDFFNRQTGVAAGIVMALAPEFIAYTQVATIESPLVLLVSLTMYAFMLSLKKESRNYFLAAAILFGLVLGTKYNGVLILPVIGLMFLIYSLAKLRDRSGKLDAATIIGNLRTIVPVVPMIVFASLVVLVFFAIWPWLWSDPVGQMRPSLDPWASQVQEYFLGVKQVPPLFYYPIYFLVTIPALLLIPLAVGIVSAARSKDAFKIGILLLFIIPFAYNLSSFIREGIRYIIIIYPAVALLCGYGLYRIGELVYRWKGKANVTETQVFWGLTGITGVYLLITAASVSPYYLDYYNVLSGGPQNVQEHKLFKFSWWGEGIKESMDWVNDNAKPGSTIMMMTYPEDKANTMYFNDGMSYIYPLFSSTGSVNKEYNFTREPSINFNGETRQVSPDYVIINQAMTDLLNITFSDSSYRVIYTSKVGGAPLVTVYKNMTAI